MKATNSTFDTVDVSDSLDRINAVLDAPDGGFEERDSIPPADALTFENGFYVNCAAVFIDIRGSSKLPSLHKRPVLAKIYRAYISECVAVLNADPNCREVFITGDCISGIFEARLQGQLNGAFERAAMLNSLVKILNWRLEKKGYTTIQCGIGLAWGRALMLKAGYKGSGINDLVWMGDVVNEASNLCGRGRKDGNATVQVSSVVYHNLNEQYRGFLTSQFDLELSGFRYEGDVVNVAMEKWFKEQVESERQAQALSSILDGLFQKPAPAAPSFLFQNPEPATPPSAFLSGLFAVPPVKPGSTALGLAGLLEPASKK